MNRRRKINKTINKNKVGICIFSIIIGVVSMLFFISPNLNAGPNDIVYIPDEALKRMINAILKFDENHAINESEILRLDALEASGVRNLEGLQYAKNLTDLSLVNASIIDYQILKNLHLSHLVIYRSRLKEIPKLPSSLIKLELIDNEISKIENLDNLTSLCYLNISNNQISKIEGLDNLTNLNELYLGGNQISKIEGLDNLRELLSLMLSSNNISKIEGLDNLTNLKKVFLDPQFVVLNIKAKEFNFSVMDRNNEIEPKITDEFKDNITKIGKNRYRIDNEGIKKLKGSKVIFEWNKKVKIQNAHDNTLTDGVEFDGRVYAKTELKQKDLFEPKIVQNKKIKVGDKLDLTTLLLNKPENARVEVVSDIDTNSLGKKIGKIKVTFSDESFKEIEVEVFINTFDVQINYLNKKDEIVKSEVKEVNIDQKN